MKPFDDLDRALAALELEVPPAGLRAQILAATIYRQPAIFKAWEIWLIGALLAVATWLALLVWTGAGERFTALASALVGGLSAALMADTATLVWLLAGVSTVLWMANVNLPAAPRRIVR